MFQPFLALTDEKGVQLLGALRHSPIILEVIVKVGPWTRVIGGKGKLSDKCLCHSLVKVIASPALH